MPPKRQITYLSQHWRKSCSPLMLQAYSNDFIKTWSDRSCGLACVGMLINHLTTYKINMIDLFETAYQARFYTKNGWLHTGLVTILQAHGLNAQAKSALSAEIIQGLLSNRLYIVSVTLNFPVDCRRGGHLVLATNYEQETVFFNDPATWGETCSELPKDTFFASYADRCIEVNCEI